MQVPALWKQSNSEVAGAALPRLAAHRKYGTLGLRHDLVCIRANEVRDSGEVTVGPVHAKDDHIRSMPLGDFQNLVRRRPTLYNTVRLASQICSKWN